MLKLIITYDTFDCVIEQTDEGCIKHPLNKLGRKWVVHEKAGGWVIGDYAKRWEYGRICRVWKKLMRTLSFYQKKPLNLHFPPFTHSASS